MVAVFIYTEQSIIRTDISFKPRVISTCGVNHNALGFNFSAGLIAVVVGEDKFA